MKSHEGWTAESRHSQGWTSQMFPNKSCLSLGGWKWTGDVTKRHSYNAIVLNWGWMYLKQNHGNLDNVEDFIVLLPLPRGLLLGKESWSAQTLSLSSFLVSSKSDSGEQLQLQDYNFSQFIKFWIIINEEVKHRPIIPYYIEVTFKNNLFHTHMHANPHV